MSRGLLLACLVAVVALGYASTTSAYVGVRDVPVLQGSLEDRGALFFRALDFDQDRRISSQDVRQSSSHLSRHLPGVTPKEFDSFIEVADTNNDGVLDQDEFMRGLAMGLGESMMLETSSTTTPIKRKPHGSDRPDDACVMCQYIVERCERNVKESGVLQRIAAQQMPAPAAAASAARGLPKSRGRGFFGGAGRRRRAAPGAAPTPPPSTEPGTAAPAPAAEAPAGGDAAPAPAPAPVPAPAAEGTGNVPTPPPPASGFLQISENPASFGERNPLERLAANMIDSSRQTTKYQRQLEREKYNEVYRVVDVSLDDVCEQSMPNRYYKFCKVIYGQQGAIVDGLRYQYRATDICYRIGACTKQSYIAKGIHSRYKDFE